MTNRWGLPPWRDPDPDPDDEADKGISSFEELFFGTTIFNSYPWCAACPDIGVPPLRPAVGGAWETSSKPEDLCSLHRGRATEGGCVICGRGLVWMEIHRGGGFGCCRPCYVNTWGEEEATRLEEWRKSHS